MNNKKVYFIMLGLTVLCFIMVIAAATGGVLLLKKQSDKLVSLRLENQVLEEQDRAISLAQQDIAKYDDLAQTARSIVPQDKDQAKTVREIDRIASEKGIKLSDFTFETSTLGQAAPKKAAESTPADTSGATAAAPTAPPVTQVEPVKGINGVYQLPVSTQATGYQTTYTSLIGFLQGLENNRRTAQVQQISIQPSPKNPALLNFTMQFNVYLRP